MKSCFGLKAEASMRGLVARDQRLRVSWVWLLVLGAVPERLEKPSASARDIMSYHIATCHFILYQSIA